MNETEGNPWLEVQAAVLPAREVAALAPLRARSGLRLYIHEDRVWVRWPGDGDDIVQILLPVPGVEFFTTRAGNWFRFGSLLPVTMPRWDGDGLPATVVLLPQPIAASAPITEEYFPPLMLRIVRGGEPQAVTALSCSLHELQRWADTATSREIAGVRGALCEALRTPARSATSDRPGRHTLLGRRLVRSHRLPPRTRSGPRGST